MGGEAHPASRPPTSVSELETLKNEIEALESLHLVSRVDAGAGCWVDRRQPICREVFSCAFSPSASSRTARRHRSGVAGCSGRDGWGSKISGRGRGGRAPSAKASLALKPGTVLEREHGGAIHRVTVTEDGCSWNGREFRSLSEAALAITGTKWYGPRFFRVAVREEG